MRNEPDLGQVTGHADALRRRQEELGTFTLGADSIGVHGGIEPPHPTGIDVGAGIETGTQLLDQADLFVAAHWNSVPAAQLPVNSAGEPRGRDRVHRHSTRHTRRTSPRPRSGAVGGFGQDGAMPAPVLVAAHHSTTADQVVARAARLAVAVGAELHVVSVVQDP